MMHRKGVNVLHCHYLFCVVAAFFANGVLAVPQHDLSAEKVLYTVGTAHLDTQWRWTIQTSINDYIKKTLDDNFSRFAAYPNYTFSFEGAFRYMLMKEYYPSRYAQMADYIEQGRWRVAGSTLENGDMNVVSPESLIRQTLIGNNYFEDEFNKRSTDIFLPDCFGFSYTMPTWAAHCGLNGFSTQKLSWGGAISTPFNIGVWKGPDGGSIIAALNPGSYTSTIGSDLSNDSGWLNTINALGNAAGVFAGYKYFGTGDTGGAPSAGSCDWLEQSIAGTGPITVVSAGSDDLYNDITAAQKAALPVYDGELLMRIHGTGCYTSQAAMKRWNRQNELLADSAERVSVIADWLGGVAYPADTLDDAWIRFLWHSFHDDLTGTSIPQAYPFSWNDEILSLNQFASVLTSGAANVSRAMDTQTTGLPVVVYNPLGFAREDIVEARLVYPAGVPAYVRVFDGSEEVPSQVLSRDGQSLTVAFRAVVPSVGFKVFDVIEAAAPCAMETGLSVETHVIENALYRVTLNAAGDIASIFDKQNNREILSAPSRLELLSDYSPSWPAWEIRYEDVQQSPDAYVAGPAKIAIVEQGPARATLRITRTYGQEDEISTFVQDLSLAAGGDRISVENKIDWRSKGLLLKAAFPLSAHNPRATYDLGMGTIQRPNNQSNMYEVPAQQWADITHTDNAFGAAILNDSRYGWDKPADNILRLTLLHTPAVNTSYTDQSTQDLGQHQLTYEIAPHTGDWVAGQIPQRAARLNQPLVAFQSDKHAGYLGRAYSFMQIDNPAVFVKAIKKAQRSDEIIVRFLELYGAAANAGVTFAGGIQSARQVDGCERPVAGATVTDGRLEFGLTKYQPKTFALTLMPPAQSVAPAAAAPLVIPCNMDAFSFDSNRSNGDFSAGLTYPAELLDESVTVAGIPFVFGPTADGQNNALFCDGQAVYLGSSGYPSLYILAAARQGDTQGTFIAGGQAFELSIQDYHEHVANWGRQSDVPYIKRDTVAWVGTHRHRPAGNLAYEFCNMFLYRIDLPAGASSLILPDNNDIVIFAVTRANNPAGQVRAAGELYDVLPYLPQLAPKPELRRNLALNKPVLADGFISGETPALAVDGQVLNNSKWCVSAAQVVPHWLIVDLQQVLDVDTFVIRHAAAGGETSDWNTSDFCIQASANGTDNWQDLVCVVGNSEAVSRHVIDPTAVRYLRLYITKPAQNTSAAVRIYEFEVYGPCDGYYIEGDLTGPEGICDCRVDLYDFELIAANWALCNEPLDMQCYDYWTNAFPDSPSASVSPSVDPGTLPEQHLIARWNVREGSGQTLHDLAGADDAGTLGGTTLPQWTAGWFSQDPQNYALYFNGSGYVQVNPVVVPSGPDLDDLENAISISAWIKADDWNGNRRILQKGSSDNQYRLLAEWNKMVFDIANVGEIQTELPQAGIWHHIAAIYDGQSMRLYIDGLQKAFMYAGGEINRTSDSLYIGSKSSQGSSGDFFKGYLDEIRVYGVGLTEAQVSTLALQGDNIAPTIVDINRSHDRLVSIMGSVALDAVVYDFNGDPLTYQWTEQSSSPYVSFGPSAFVEDPQAIFAQPGDYALQLAVSDGSGQSAVGSVEFHLDAMDCQAVRQMNYRIEGDIDHNCYINLQDLVVLSSQWLSCEQSGCL